MGSYHGADASAIAPARAVGLGHGPRRGARHRVDAANVVALVFTLVFTRVLGQADYGSLGALISTFLILNGARLRATDNRRARGERRDRRRRPECAGAGLRRWLRRLVLLAVC